MWTSAHINVFLMVIQTHVGFIRHVLHQAKFISLTTLQKGFDDFISWGHFFDDIIILVDELYHASFNLCHVTKGKRAFAINVVIKAIINDRPDDHFNIRVELFDRMT